ncbi:MAG: hypothetical protein A2W28_09535 [Gammaproteobacteria bacterium RBG_16_51_14]|nr:MAG: hypothetical protein A2W28_09535 [Gammaproteobacteria bacterium RBG_16_51_14]
MDLTLIKSRDILVKARTKLINHVQGTVKSVGGRLPSCSAASFDKKVVDSIPEELRCALQPIVETIASLTSRIRDYDREIEKLCQERYPEAEHLQRVGGIGPVTSLAYILTLEDPGRFGKSREVGAYIGLVPKRDQSGERDPQLMITKEGDSYLRSLLVGSGQYILGPFGPDCDLRRWGLKLMERGGKNAKKRAVVAVARKLAVLLHRLWTTGEIYDPFYHAKREKEPAGVMKVSPCSAGEEEELELMLTGECSKG